MDLLRANEVVKNSFLNSPLFPYDTGNLKDNFFDTTNIIQSDNSIEVGILSSRNLIKGARSVNYGKLLEVAPSIRYRKKGLIQGRVTHIRHKNRHFRYIENIIENDVVSAIENEFGVKRI